MSVNQFSGLLATDTNGPGTDWEDDPKRQDANRSERIVAASA